MSVPDTGGLGAGEGVREGMPLRRDVLRGGAVTGAVGVASMLLPAAAAHASGHASGPGFDGQTSDDWSFDSTVSALARHQVGEVDGIVAGGFYSAGDDGLPGRFTRVLSTTLLDTGFDTKASPAVGTTGRANAFAVQGDGKVVLAGAADFTSALIVRVAADGTPDTAFNSNVPVIAGGRFNQAWDVLVRSDGANAGKILIAGDFATATPAGGGTAVNRFGLLQLNTDGTLDTTFAPDWSYTMDAAGDAVPVGRAVIVLGGGDVIVAGSRIANGAAVSPGDRAIMLRVNGSTGALSATLLAGDPNVTRVAVLSDGRLLALRSVAPNEAGGGVIVDPGTGDSVAVEIVPAADSGRDFRAMVPDGADAFIVGGTFPTIAGGSQSNLARIVVSGLGAGQTPTVTRDTGFVAQANDRVWSVARRGNGDLAIGGAFTDVNGEARSRFALLSPSGVLR
jgi:hypothetical protein